MNKLNLTFGFVLCTIICSLSVNAMAANEGKCTLRLYTLEAHNAVSTEDLNAAVTNQLNLISRETITAKKNETTTTEEECKNFAFKYAKNSTALLMASGEETLIVGSKSYWDQALSEIHFVIAPLIGKECYRLEIPKIPISIQDKVVTYNGGKGSDFGVGFNTYKQEGHISATVGQCGNVVPSIQFVNWRFENTSKSGFIIPLQDGKVVHKSQAPTFCIRIKETVNDDGLSVIPVKNIGINVSSKEDCEGAVDSREIQIDGYDIPSVTGQIKLRKEAWRKNGSGGSFGKTSSASVEIHRDHLVRANIKRTKVFFMDSQTSNDFWSWW